MKYVNCLGKQNLKETILKHIFLLIFFLKNVFLLACYVKTVITHKNVLKHNVLMEA